MKLTRILVMAVAAAALSVFAISADAQMRGHNGGGTWHGGGTWNGGGNWNGGTWHGVLPIIMVIPTVTPMVTRLAHIPVTIRAEYIREGL